VGWLGFISEANSVPVSNAPAIFNLHSLPVQMFPRPRAQPWASFPPPGPPGTSTNPSGPLRSPERSLSAIISSDQAELLMQQLTDAAAVSGSHAGAPGGYHVSNCFGQIMLMGVVLTS
jgi:hypothetical protein